MKNYIIKTKTLIETITKLNNLYCQKAKEMSVKTVGYMLLYALCDNQIHTQKELCNAWSFPRTTLNTVVKDFEKSGYIELVALPKYKRDLQIILTEKGKVFADKILYPIYKAEKNAIDKTIEKFNVNFIDALQFYSENLKIEFNNLEKLEANDEK